MNPQESITNFTSLTKDIIETTVPAESNEHISTEKRKSKPGDLNYKSLLQFVSMILQIVFQFIILV
jgi:hypothetical protein